MLILVGVTVNVAFGENGIIKTARDAAAQQEAERKKEQAEAVLASNLAEYYSNGETNIKHDKLVELNTKLITEHNDDYDTRVPEIQSGEIEISNVYKQIVEGNGKDIITGVKLSADGITYLNGIFVGEESDVFSMEDVYATITNLRY